MKKLVALTIVVAMLVPALAKAAPAGFHAPPPTRSYWAYCGSGVWGWHGPTHYTSCPFALNIGRGVRSSSDWGSYRLVGTAYSPVTHRTYYVNCTKRYSQGSFAYRCTAGIGAVAWVS